MNANVAQSHFSVLNILAEAWKPYMKDLDTFYTDATCYESEMCYPTYQKLLWECCEKAYSMMCELSRRLEIHRPRTWSTWQSDWQNKNKSRQHGNNSDYQEMESSAENSLSMVVQSDKNITKMIVRQQKTQ